MRGPAFLLFLTLVSSVVTVESFSKSRFGVIFVFYGDNYIRRKFHANVFTRN